MSSAQLQERVEERLREWQVIVQETLETQSSLVVFGTRDLQPVVLKVIRQVGDEWRSGEVLQAFDEKGVVKVYEATDGVVLLERLDPGISLVPMTLQGGDDEATEIIADVIQRMAHPRECLERFVTVAEWGKGFQRYTTSGDHQIPRLLTEKGERWYTHLCATQQDLRLLHGDLQHYNILFDRERGWLAIDPKGVVGELEYEIGTCLRNPGEVPELLTMRERIEARLKRFESQLKLDASRALAWGFAQAVLSVIWSVEDGFPVASNNPALMLAQAIEPMLSDSKVPSTE